MREILEQQLARFEELERLMVDPDVLANPARLAAIAREHGSLAKSATKYRRFKQLNAQITEANAMASGDDLELRQMAEMELADLKAEREALWTRNPRYGCRRRRRPTHPLHVGNPRRHRRR